VIVRRFQADEGKRHNDPVVFLGFSRIAGAFLEQVLSDLVDSPSLLLPGEALDPAGLSFHPSSKFDI